MKKVRDEHGKVVGVQFETWFDPLLCTFLDLGHALGLTHAPTGEPPGVRAVRDPATSSASAPRTRVPKATAQNTAMPAKPTVPEEVASVAGGLLDSSVFLGVVALGCLLLIGSVPATGLACVAVVVTPFLVVVSLANRKA